MAVQDDVRRLSQLDSIYLGESINGVAAPITSWHKGRLQQANDGTWVFRSSSSDGAVVGFQLGPISPQWISTEAPSSGIQVTIPMTTMGAPIGSVYLQQQLPTELTN
jgi:hypothetical protein